MNQNDKINKVAEDLSNFSEKINSQSNLDESINLLHKSTKDLINSHSDEKQRTYFNALLQSDEHSLDKMKSVIDALMSDSRFDNEIQDCQNKIYNLRIQIPIIENRKTELIERLNKGAFKNESTDSLSHVERDLSKYKGALVKSEQELERLNLRYNKSRIDELESKVHHYQKTETIILTEDRDVTKIQVILQSNEIELDKVKVITYKGIKNELFHNSIELIHHLSPWSKVIVHRDRDLLEEIEVERLYKKAQELRYYLFITDGYDIESYFITKEHIKELFPNIEANVVEDIINNAINDCKESSVKKIQNVNKYQDSEAVFMSNPIRYVYSKKVFKIICSKLNGILKEPIELVKPSKALQIDFFKNLIKKVDLK